MSERRKMRFFSLKHKVTGQFRGTFIAENVDEAMKLAVKNRIIGENEYENYTMEDITQKPTAREKATSNVITGDNSD